MNTREFAKRYAPYNRQGEFWQGWLVGENALSCPYEKGTPKHTAWCLGVEAREDYNLEQKQGDKD